MPKAARVTPSIDHQDQIKLEQEENVDTGRSCEEIARSGSGVPGQPQRGNLEGGAIPSTTFTESGSDVIVRGIGTPEGSYSFPIHSRVGLTDASAKTDACQPI
jgi:hypothetical protein